MNRQSDTAGRVGGNGKRLIMKFGVIIVLLLFETIAISGGFNEVCPFSVAYPHAVRLMNQRRAALRNNYKTDDGKNSDSCYSVAMEVAVQLVEDGATPHLVTFKENIQEDGIFQTRVFRANCFTATGPEWSTHTVAVADELVFDPLLDKPTPLSEYSQAAFGESIPYQTTFRADYWRTLLDEEIKTATSKGSL